MKQINFNIRNKMSGYSWEHGWKELIHTERDV